MKTDEYQDKDEDEEEEEYEDEYGDEYDDGDGDDFCAVLMRWFYLWLRVAACPTPV